MEVPTAASERGLEVVIDIEKNMLSLKQWEKNHQSCH